MRTLLFGSLEHLAPVPLTVFLSNSKFNQNLELECFSLEYAHRITTKYCTRHECANFIVKYILNQRTSNFGLTSNSTQISFSGMDPDLQRSLNDLTRMKEYQDSYNGH